MMSIEFDLPGHDQSHRRTFDIFTAARRSYPLSLT